MPHQEHLQEVGGQLTHASRVRSPHVRLAALTLIAALRHFLRLRQFRLRHLFAIFGLLAGAAHAQLPGADIDLRPLTFERIEAVRAGADWHATQPPDTGWESVTLPDVWSTRWPHYDGVVWYRLTWQETSPAQARGLLLEYLNMAGAVYLNGSLLSREDSLVEPLTRAWNTPRYWVVEAPALRPGVNTLLLRVSGLSAYSPGLGPVVRGAPAEIHARYEKERWVRRDLQLFSLAITITLGIFVLTLWLYRREETAYGWFSAMSFTWWLYAVNQVATRPWPWVTNDAWEVFVSIAFLAYCGCFTMFVLRFCGRRMPRIETAMWTIFGAGAVWLMVMPHQSIASTRAIWAVVPGVTYLASCILLFALTWRERQLEQRVVSLCALTFVIAGTHDFLVFFGVLASNVYYTAQTSQVLMIGMAVVLARRFAENARRIAQFNDELRVRVDDARDELALTLNRQHELEVANARLAERLNLAHDLHDGLGGALVSSIAAIEHAPHTLPPERFLGLLKELRDELRMVIDTAATHQNGGLTLAEQIAPLRHRITVLFESQKIECDWRLEGIGQCELSAAQSLELLRILQEALTNVLKHSRASRVRIDLRDEGEAITLRVEDNGVGFEVGSSSSVGGGSDTQHAGAGLHSMRRRAQRLGGTMALLRENGATVVLVRVATRAG
ncbi:ATP-binding protein [Pandoraea sp. PE-S2R-1]|uniref:sensor histidine kinase n=1 Tax=Pandoraea sp. PE-S2R-1 TaxID=1986994 RepID=UPI000B3FDAFA|nr:7TM diverse intracellular signaling domain-containing protein [Pandoraea sp. PE-S2R-1]